MSDTTRRRYRHDLHTPAEKAITAAVEAVEAAGCDTLLTEAVVLLGEARDKVADFVDRKDASFPKARLQVPSGELVQEVTIPPFQKLPEVLIWGARHFKLVEPVDLSAPVYSEVCAFWVSPEL